MRSVKVVKIDFDNVTNILSPYNLQYPLKPHKVKHISNSHDVCMDMSVEIENIPIQRIVSHGREFYIAVQNNVWKYLYLLENPVTAESQEKRIKHLERERDNWREGREYFAKAHSRLRNRTYSASFWKRLKWLFTGIKF